MSLLLLAAAEDALDTTDLPDWAPTADEIAAFMYGRVNGEWGREERFTSTTQPTITQVSNAIIDAISLVQPQVGYTLDTRFNASAKTHAKLKTALLLEPSFWPDQQSGDKSAWEQWQKLYDDGIKGLVEAIREAGAGDDPGPADDEAGPVWSFPTAPRSDSACWPDPVRDLW